MSYFKQKSSKRSIVLFCKSCDSAQQLWAYFYLSRLNMEASTLLGFSPKLRQKKLKKSQNLQLTLWMFLQTADKVHSKNSSNDGTRANSQRSHLQHERQPEKILYYASDPDYGSITDINLSILFLTLSRWTDMNWLVSPIVSWNDSVNIQCI